MPRVNYTDEVFKKTEQVVGKPQLMTHNINDEYMKNAPLNRPEGSTAVNEHKQHYTPGPTKGDLIEDEASRVDEGLPTGAPDQTLGRMSKTTGLAEATQDSMHR
ncbi:hypothetical protein HYPSUDRAFT_644074 [Hypholoma sublateritium FD-334 SS-4]|uniref:Uncharacterized protein n=1 Tax=Hypholoma sublateritium (strain FD-334 SS-4) TaxID=945553 RepID=A0A0D2P1R9_HYPSF|nr:hypothetical protein HYPSUDRAFT_644074 [Hypholoma sublateritium FD-334 SS-4]